MSKSCPSCGFVSPPEARYCRMCGTPLPGARAEYADHSDVSPQAATVPLGGERPTTGDIAQHETEQPVTHPTAPFGSEFEDFWRGVEGKQSGPARAPEAAEAEGDRRPLTIPVRPIDTSRLGESPHGSEDATRYADEATRYADDERTRASAPRPAPPPRAAATTGGLDDAAAPHDSGVAAGPARPGEAGRASVPTRQTDSIAANAQGASAPNAQGANAAGAPARNAPEDRALRMWGGLAIFGLAVVVLAATAVGLGWYFMRSLRAPAAQPGASAAPNASAAPAPPGDARALGAAKLREAETLLAAGRTDEAVARLRDAAALDPSNAEPHRRLARLLLEGGARRTAIEELRAVVRIDPADAKSWRELAGAQSAEGLHRDAAESYRRLNEADGGARADDRVQLAYADALRQSGRESDAKVIYQRLSSSRVAEVARAGRQRLAQLAREAEEAEEGETDEEASASPSPTQTPARREERAAGEESRTPNEPARTESGRVEEVFTGRAPAPSPSPQNERLSPRERYERGVRLWASNRQAAVSDFAAAAQAGNADANYYLGLNLAEGRDARAMRRGELMAALTYFQRARRGRHSGDARRYEGRLLREYDRRSGAVNRERP